MKIIITAIGSRGDIQPYIALAQGFQRAGHEVCLSSPYIFKALVAGHNVQQRPISVNPQDIMNHPAVQAAAQSGNQILFLKSLFRESGVLIKTFLEEVYTNCQDGQLIISSMIPYGAYDVAEKRSIPFIQTVLAPYYPTTAFAAPGVRLPINWPFINRLSHYVIDQSFWQFFRSIQNRWRKERLQLSAYPFWGPFQQIRRHSPTIMGYSPTVVATPADWPSSVFVTGYWFLDEAKNWNPPAGLVSFLDTKPVPIYIGFGSMPERDAAHMTQLILDALRISGQRCVLLSGWAGLGRQELPETVYCVESIPHCWLFKRVSVVVHHGGAGTTAAGLFAGVPSVITPYTADQFFWGERISELGVGPKAVPYHNLTAEILAAMIHQAVADNKIQNRAAEVGKHIQAENGVRNAVKIIERYAASI
jgi:sterol 3beta-glucosyltransferase